MSQRTVQDAVEQAISRVADQAVSVVAAGRTDAGVHATGQIIHCETDARRAAREWLFGVNANLPGDVSVHWCSPVPMDFHARYSATARTYRYLILNRNCRSAVLRNRVAWVCQQLDAQAMHEAAQALVGEHDFSAFRASGCQAKTAQRCVQAITVQRERQMVVVEITANAFLHNMVRIVVGTLVRVGRGLEPASWVREVLDGGDRRRGGATAPAQALYLVAVRYPDRFEVPVPDHTGSHLAVW